MSINKSNYKTLFFKIILNFFILAVLYFYNFSHIFTLFLFFLKIKSATYLVEAIYRTINRFFIAK